jgi:hypothetical protein
MPKHGFQKIDPTAEETCGPEAVLVCGFPATVEEPLRNLLTRVGAGNHRVVLCTPRMVKQELGRALEPRPDDTDETPAAPDELPRVMVLSGMTGGQLQNFVSSYRTTGLPRPIFASTTPINVGFPVGRLIVDLLKEHRAMARR